MTARNVIALSKDKTEENHPWEARKEEICETEFEETRRCLFNSYHSYVQTHAGYMIAITISLFALISNFDPFFKSGPVVYTLSFSTSVSLIFTWGFVIFLILIILIMLAGLYMILRIMYWTTYANFTMTLTLDSAIQLFNEYNSASRTYLTRAPYMAILGIAVTNRFENDKGLRWHDKMALKTAHL